MAYVIGDDCIAGGTCIDECPSGAISEGDKYSINPDICTECGTCADVCPAGNESAEGGSGSGCGKISDRDHADDVYSGRCRSAERMGYIKTSADSDNCDLVCIHNCSYGCFRKSNTDDD